MKVCVKSPLTDCETSAQCMSACRDNMDQSECICQDRNFPEKWAKPTCKGIWNLISTACKNHSLFIFIDAKVFYYNV